MPRCCRSIAARGPIQWAIVNGETRTGVTTMRIDAGLDTGDMLLKAETEIGPDETAVELGARLAAMGADLLVETLAGIDDASSPEKQDTAQATYAPLLKKEDGLIDWTPAGAGDPQSRARLAALARRLHHAFADRRCTSGNRAWRHGGEPRRSPGNVCQLQPLRRRLRRQARSNCSKCSSKAASESPAADFANGQRMTDNEILGESQT